MSTFVILSVCCVILSHFIQSFHNYCIFSQQDVYEDWMVLGEAAKHIGCNPKTAAKNVVENQKI